MVMDDDNERNNAARNVPLEEDGAIRRNQVLIFGVVLLGILAICLAVSMPSDLEFNDTELPSSPAGPINPEVDPSTLSPLDSTVKRNQTNSTRKKTLRHPSEVSVEVKLLRDMAIQKKIQEYDSSSNNHNRLIENAIDSGESRDPPSKEELESIKVNNIVETFIESEDFEDFLIDMEIHNAVAKLRLEKGYKNRPSTIFDELFKRAEKEFIGEDEEELQLIRRVGEELEKRAMNIINERKKTRGKELTEPEQLLANELLLKLEFSGSGDFDQQQSDKTSDEDNNEDIFETKKTEL